MLFPDDVSIIWLILTLLVTHMHTENRQQVWQRGPTDNSMLQRIPKLQQHDQAVWWDTLGKMQKLLRKAALSLANGGKIDKDTMHNYFMSGEMHRSASSYQAAWKTVVNNA